MVSDRHGEGNTLRLCCYSQTGSTNRMKDIHPHITLSCNAARGRIVYKVVGYDRDGEPLVPDVTGDFSARQRMGILISRPIYTYGIINVVTKMGICLCTKSWPVSVWVLCRHDNASFTFVSYDAMWIACVMQHRKVYGFRPMVCIYHIPSFHLILTTMLLLRFNSLAALRIEITVFWNMLYTSLVYGLLRNVGAHVPNYVV
jgi:hypothetical protein